MAASGASPPLAALIRELTAGGPVITDGAWGTELQARGLPAGTFPDAWNLPVGNNDMAADGDHSFFSYMDDTIFLNARSTTNTYFPKITAQYSTCPDKTIPPYLDITDDCCLRMNIGGLNDSWNFVLQIYKWT